MKLIKTGILLLTGLITAPVYAFDLAAGQEQHAENCTSCHGSEIYTRPDRRIQSHSALSTQVQRCQLALNLNWFEDEVENTAEFLNREYYRFND